MNLPIGVGVIGCGVISGTHLASYQKIDTCRPVAVCDVIPERAQSKADRFDVAAVTTDYRDLLADDNVHAVSVCTDHASHAQIVCDALAAGKHVLCEKALAAKVDGLDAMLQAHAAAPQLVFAGVFQHRFDGINIAVRKLVTDGAFGEMLTAGFQLRCHRTSEYYSDGWHGTWEHEGGSVLINQAIHFVDAICWIMGGAKTLVAAHRNIAHKDDIETEDTLTAAVRYRNGALGTFEATSASHINWENSIAIHGSAGSLDIRNGRVTKAEFADKARGEAIAELLEQANDPMGVDAARNYYGTGHLAQVRDFVDAIVEKRQPRVTGEAARHAVDVVLGAYRSQQTGGWVDVPAPIQQPATTATA